MNQCPHCQAALTNAAQATFPAPVERMKDTSVAGQEDFILAALRRAGPVGLTTDDLRNMGAYQVSARVFGLRARGVVIHTERYSGYASDGVYHCGMARYRLVSEPLPLYGKGAAQ